MLIEWTQTTLTQTTPQQKQWMERMIRKQGAIHQLPICFWEEPEGTCVYPVPLQDPPLFQTERMHLSSICVAVGTAHHARVYELTEWQQMFHITREG